MFTHCPQYWVLLMEQSSWTKLSIGATAMFFLKYFVTSFLYISIYIKKKYN